MGTLAWACLAVLNVFTGCGLLLAERDNEGYALLTAGAVCLLMGWWRL